MDETTEYNEYLLNGKKRRSAVWRYFEQSSTQPGKAICKLCGLNLSRGIGRNASTSSLRNHLQKKHPDEYQLMARNEPKPLRKNDDAEESCENIANKATKAMKSTSDVNATPRPRSRKSRVAVQPASESTVEQVKPRGITNNQTIALHYAIGEMIALDNQPYSFVENAGFQRLMKTVQPHYKIPDRTHFMDKIIPDIFKRVNAVIRDRISAARWLSLTSDVWTCSENNFSFVSFTAHWITSDFEMSHAVLNVKYFHGHHTALFIASILEETIHDWALAPDKVHVLIRDNGANINEGVNDMGIQSIGCFLHNLQLVINDSISSQHSVSDMIGKSRSLVEHFHRSSAACSRLHEIQLELNEPQNQLVQDVETRWNSTFYMLQRLLEQKKAIAVYCSEVNGGKNLNSNDWVLMEATISILEPFEQLTKRVSSSRSFISEVIPYVNTLKEYLSSNNAAHFGVGAMKIELTKSLNNRFGEIESSEFFTLATFLDPRYRMQFFNGAITKMQTKELILERIEQQCGINSLVNNVSGEPSEWLGSPENAIAKSQVSFFQYLKNKTASKVPLTVLGCDRHNTELELNVYISGELCPGDKCIIEWWRENKYLYPSLSKLVPRYLCALASSVCNEPFFSEPGLTYEDHRSRLTPDHTESLLFIHHNLPNLTFNY